MSDASDRHKQPFSGAIISNENPVEIEFDKEKIFSCPECNKKYSHHRTRRQHVKKCHPAQIDALEPSTKGKKLYNFKCSYCEKNFNKKSYLNFHIRSDHPGRDTVSFKTVICLLCKDAIEKNKYFTHCQLVHDIPITTEEKHFSTYEEFCSWKKEIEKSTKASFIKTRLTTVNKNDVEKTLLMCHRSRFYATKSVQRHTKILGSCKINGFCPARIELSRESYNECNVVYIKTHLGHENDL